jgi:glycosyl transferase family 25
MKFSDKIEQIYYINLEHRKDRFEHINQVISNLEIDKTRVKKIDAIYVPENGSLGCAISHISTIQNFISLGKSNCLILEDDFNYYNKDVFIKSINYFLELSIDWNIVQLSSNLIKHELTTYKGITKIIESQTTSGYLLNKNFAEELLDNFLESKQNLSSGYNLEYCIDQNWKKIQPANLWYGFYPQIGYQIDGFSDIENQIVSYKC